MNTTDLSRILWTVVQEANDAGDVETAQAAAALADGESTDPDADFALVAIHTVNRDATPQITQPSDKAPPPFDPNDEDAGTVADAAEWRAASSWGGHDPHDSLGFSVEDVSSYTTCGG